MNMNDRVSVRLTEAGRRTWHKYTDGHNFGLDGSGVLRTQFWTLANAFGPMLYNGAIEMPFVDNVLELEAHTVWAVKFSNYEPAEVASLHASRASAEAEVARLNAKGKTTMWCAEAMVVEP